MPLPPQQRRHPLHINASNPSLANADQNLTALDARLTKVDKGCQNLTPSTPPRTPNNPEQIRTPPNAPTR